MLKCRFTENTGKWINISCVSVKIFVCLQSNPARECVAAELTVLVRLMIRNQSVTYAYGNTRNRLVGKGNTLRF